MTKFSEIFKIISNNSFLFQYYKTTSITCCVSFPMLGQFDKNICLNGKKMNNLEKSLFYGIIGFSSGPIVPILGTYFLIFPEKFNKFEISRS